jgi:Trp operon repressor
MTGAEQHALERVIRELEGDVSLARTRDEHVRLCSRVLALRELLQAVTGQRHVGESCRVCGAQVDQRCREGCTVVDLAA